MLRAIVQEEITGCAIASAAVLAGLSYTDVRELAGRLGISADDRALWTETAPLRILLQELGVPVEATEEEFSGWETLPDCALLAIKWHTEKGRPAWHWTVFVRDADGGYVLDSKKSLKSNIRTDFGRIKPKWFIAVKQNFSVRD